MTWGIALVASAARGLCRPTRRTTADLTRNFYTRSKYTPRRAVLYVPGNDRHKIENVAKLKVDCAVLDCEDGVAANRKICYKLQVHLQQYNLSVKVNLILYIESAQGLINLREICSKGIDKSALGSFQLDGIVFGSDDYIADIGATRTKDASELIYARQKIVTVCKAFRLQAIDLVDIDYKDLDGLREQAVAGARMGFTGKQVIHPNQIPVVQDAFSPSPEMIEWATELIRAFDEQQESGQ
ncbi:PREDICTED: citrate lyase subunit beta-like protein, mitochondrial, partial [Priapulus caudatus]|uniref:Citrate lyase subunit beta-like protein, mitochondrial n=1 Tax=Priapulus caudatus TaxID=37621 RepID=A0ABM1F5D8_PRICU